MRSRTRKRRQVNCTARTSSRGRGGSRTTLHLLQRTGQPIQSFVQPFAACRDCALHVPPSCTQLRQTKVLAHLGRRHGSLQVLFIGKDKQSTVPHQRILNDRFEFACRSPNPLAVQRIHHIDQTVGVVEIVPPKWSQLLLTTHIPHRELHVLVLYLLYVESWWNEVVLKSVSRSQKRGACAPFQDPQVRMKMHVLKRSTRSPMPVIPSFPSSFCFFLTYGRNCTQHFSNVKLVQDGGFSSSVQPQHHNLDALHVSCTIPRTVRRTFLRSFLSFSESLLLAFVSSIFSLFPSNRAFRSATLFFSLFRVHFFRPCRFSFSSSSFHDLVASPPSSRTRISRFPNSRSKALRSVLPIVRCPSCTVHDSHVDHSFLLGLCVSPPFETDSTASVSQPTHGRWD